MKKIFTGLIFITLNINLHLGASTIGLLPDFVGYILLYQGLTELARRSRNFKDMVPLAIIMAIYTGIIYLKNLLGMTFGWGWIATLLGLAASVAMLLILRRIISGVQDIEAQEQADLNSAKLYTEWLVVVVAAAITYLMMFVVPQLSVLAILVSAVASIVFLVSFSTTKNRYLALEEQKENQGEYV